MNESNGYGTGLINNPLFTHSKTGSIGITTNQGMGTLLSAGRKICGGQNTSTAVITGVGCSALTVSVTKGGTNYISDSDVETFAVTGKGSGLRLNMTASNLSLIHI